jgi:hypothetical protein
MQRSRLRGLIGKSLALAAGAVAADAAAVPASLTHQGRLFDAEGAPVSGTVDV